MAVLSGGHRRDVFLAQGNVVIEQFEAGNVGLCPDGRGHYIKNTGDGVLRALIGFNSGHYQANDLSAWLANPVDVVSTSLGLDRALVGELPKGEHLFLPKR